MALPQRLTFVTLGLGARDLPNLRSFYRGIGWVENDGGSDTYSAFDCGSVKLALHPVDLLRDEAAPDCEPPGPGNWNGVTLAINFASADEVDVAYETAISTGASPVGHPSKREWGGYSAYFADPEGNRWELAWAPGFDDF